MYLSQRSSEPTRLVSRAGALTTPDFAETLDYSALESGFSNNDVAAVSFDLGTFDQPVVALNNLSIHNLNDHDWFRFTTPQSLASGASAKIDFDVSEGDLALRLYDAGQNLLASSGGAQGRETISLATLTLGTEYFLEVDGDVNAMGAVYSLLLTNPVVSQEIAADFFESRGGNNSEENAWRLGTADRLESRGEFTHLSFDTEDAASGAGGGDWFVVSGSRTLEANASYVKLSGAANDLGNLNVNVYDLSGNLLGSTSDDDTVRELQFAPQVTDVLIQVSSSNGGTDADYSLQILATTPVSESDNLVVLQDGSPDIVGSGLGNDTYLLSPSQLSAGLSLTLSDIQGANSIQLADGLTIASSRVASSALQLRLDNGSVVTVFGADEFSYEAGGNASAGIDGADVAYADFVQQTLGITMPIGGEIKEGGPLTIGTLTANDVAGLTLVGTVPDSDGLMG
jgi:hypothetical protein